MRNIKIYNGGILFDEVFSSKYHPTNSCISKRGKIHEFSSAAVRRLREFLLSYTIENSTCYSLCFTVPWDVSQEDPISEYKETWARFKMRFLRNYPHSGMVFRHELQKRKMPHCHAIFYYSSSDIPVQNLVKFWCEVCECPNDKKIAFLKYGVRCDKVDGKIYLWRYFTDHLSKHKQSQMGYYGKQWGIFNRKLFMRQNCHTFVFDKTEDFFADYKLKYILRQLSRIYRYNKKCDCIFGYKHCRRRNTTKVLFCNPKTVELVIKYYTKIDQ